jgi:hypothetical protein
VPAWWALVRGIIAVQRRPHRAITLTTPDRLLLVTKTVSGRARPAAQESGGQGDRGAPWQPRRPSSGLAAPAGGGMPISRDGNRTSVGLSGK